MVGEAWIFDRGTGGSKGKRKPNHPHKNSIVMEIQEIKSLLTMETVLQHYGLIPDKNHRLCCPFHNDRTPSMQVYPETNTCYCFSSNCKTHGKSLDVIDFIMYKEGTGKHEALVYAAALAGEPPTKGNQPIPVPITKTVNREETKSRKEFLGKVFAYFCTALRCSPPAKAYMQSRGLDINKTEAGYNSGQLHHGTRKDDQLIADCLRYGLLLDKGVTGRNGEPAYGVFGKGCICFALRNREKEIVSLYFRSILAPSLSERAGGEARHFYLKDRQGLYPNYPKADTKTLILAESVIDAATLIQHCHLEGVCVLACYGTNGLTEEHMEALKGLQSLEEIIFFFDGDASGRTSAKRYGEQLSKTLGCKVSTVDCPEGEDVNSLLQGHEPEIFPHLIGERKELLFSFSAERNEKETTVPPKTVLPVKAKTTPYADNELITSHPDCLLYYRGDLSFTLWGGIDIYSVNRLRTTLHIKLKENVYRSFRDSVDLYSHTQSERLIRQASEKLEISPGLLSEGITALTSALESYREQKREAKRAETTERREADRETFSEAEKQAAQRFLNDKKLNEHTHDIFGRIGLVGQQENGMLLFFIFLTRMFANPLHAIVMGSSGSGKTHLLQGVSQTVPRQHIHYTTSLSENTLYYTPKDFLKHKILLQEDLDGAYQALLP
ncbi:MAG: CHC2 zinc finger domain-containing protein, partial [Bacteroidales bacterium]|nr:CHC2 zinc finger domain-containing protein [Bacteroidales bacterium]